MTPYRHLAEPARIGPVTLRNRVVSTSHQTSLVHDHLPTADLIAYHEARARGGVGAVFLEATAIHPTGLLTAHTIGGYLAGIIPAYRQLSDTLHRHDTRLFVQLFHGGREQISVAPRAPAVAPSAVPTLRFHTEPRALTLREIRELVDGYATAARHARDGGVDGLEVSMAHGYLPAQFFAARSNRRDDGYNGSLDARLRFAREVLAAVRAAAGSTIAVGVRLAADEATPGGLGPDQCAEIAEALCRDGIIDFASLCVGYSATYIGSVGIVPPPPVEQNRIAEPARRIRRALPALPLIATTRVVDIDDAERLVAAGTADVVGMTRALIADPQLVEKAFNERASEIISCIGCNQGCIGHYHAGVPISCLANPETGRERHAPPPTVTTQPPPRMLVVGGGPAGVAAAIEAARHGARVDLVERDDQLGGQLRLAGHAPAHAELWRRYHATTTRRLSSFGVTVRLGEQATITTLDGYRHVVIATGAQPYTPPITTPAGIAIVQAWDAIRDPSALDGPVLVADWGGEYAGVDAAEVLAGAGHAVTLAYAATVPAEQAHQYQRALYLARLDAAAVTLRHHLELVGDPAALRHVFSGRVETLGAIVTLVLAQGRVPDDTLWRAVEDDPRVVRVGDVLGPRTAEEAILEGTLAAQTLLVAS